MLAPLNCIICFIVLLFKLISPIQSTQKETTENIYQVIREDKKPMTSLCPLPCYCSEDINKHQFSVTCSNRRLQNIPDIPPHVTALDLQNNQITNITCNDFKELLNLKSLLLSHNQINALKNVCIFSNQAKLEILQITYTTLTYIEPFLFSNLSQLKVLDLSYNNLIQILNNSFFGLSSLTILSLQRNNLNYYNKTFELDAFSGLDQLEIIHLEGNNPKFDFSTYPDEALSKLTNLREIFLDGYPIQLGRGFKMLQHLETIHMNDYPPETFCVFNSSIPDNFFENIVSLKPVSIDLNGCQLKYLPPNIFKPISNLIFLNLYNTRMLLLKGFENGSISLNGSNIKVLNLSKINMEEPYFSAVSRHLFCYLKYTPLESLDISSNRILTVDALAFVDLPPTLEYLSLRHNKIAKFEAFIAIFTLGHVKTIDASLQLQYKETPDDASVIYDFVCETNSKHLDSNHNSNMLKNRNETAGSNPIIIDQSYVTFYFPLPFNLEVLFISSIKVEYSLPAFTFKNNKILRYWDYSNNMARCWQGPIKAPPTLQHLDLSKNYCTKMSLTFFKYLTNLTTLLLHDNVLGPTLAKDISGIAFSTLNRLETLNISGNTITSLSRNIFQNNINLKYLNLSRNSLTHFEVDLNILHKMEVLDLTGNLLAGFSEQNCKDFKQLKAKNPNFKIKIQSNRLMCTCEYLSFVHLLITQPNIFDSVDSINCTTADGSNLSHDQLDTFYSQLMKSCVSQEIFIGTLVTFFIIIGTVLLSSMFYYNRWKFAYLYYIGSKKLHIGDVILNYAPVADVFITFEQEPEYIRLVRNVFIPRLIQNHVTYINGEDDFPAGPQHSNIPGAIAGTRKTLVLLSRDIFEDRNRELEMNLAIMHEMNCSDRIIVPVFVGEFQVNTWPVEIVTYIRNQNHRCLLYEDTEEFWEMLMSNLKDIQLK